MSNTKSRTTTRATRYTTEVADLTTYLSTIECEVKPSVHVNGSSYSTAIITVDFGSPLTPFRLSAEQSSELTEKIRVAAKAILGRDGNIRISHGCPCGLKCKEDCECMIFQLNLDNKTQSKVSDLRINNDKELSNELPMEDFYDYRKKEKDDEYLKPIREFNFFYSNRQLAQIEDTYIEE